MQTVIAPRGDARTFLTHFTGGGLDDDRYAVQRFRSMANGDIVPVHADGTKPKGRRKARPTTLSVKAVEKIQAVRLGGPALGLARDGDIHGLPPARLTGALNRPRFPGDYTR